MASKEFSSEASLDQSRETSPIPNITLEGDDEHTCRICEEKLKQPKILNCLHVFCQSCLENENTEAKNVLTCSICKQDTKIPASGIANLQPEYVISDLLEMAAIEDKQILCNSCKAKEEAVARCRDCISGNYLCGNCVTAHQFMRCFDNHEVVLFEDMKEGGRSLAHKVIFCDSHPTEHVNFFCNTCQEAVCGDCMKNFHKPPEHICENVTETERKLKEELSVLLTESKKKFVVCDEAHQTLESSLNDLQMQRDNAKGLIQETFQSYKAILEKKKDNMLEELEDLHLCQELAIMDLFHNVEKTSEKIEDGCKYTELLIQHGTGLHCALMKKMISSQLMFLINNTPKPDIHINLDFHSDSGVFEEAVKKTFGTFVKEEPKPQVERPLSSLHSSFENEGFTLPSGVLSPDQSLVRQTSTQDLIHDHFRTITPVSMTSNTPGPIGTIATSITSAIAGSQAMHDHGTSLSRNSHSPAMSDSGISVDAASNNSGSSASMMNVAALAKLHSAGLPQTPVGTAPPSLTRSEANFSSLLNPPTPQSESPNLETLASLLQQPPSSLTGGMDSVGSIGSMSSIGTIGSMSMNPSNKDMLESGGFSSGSYNSANAASMPFPPVRRGNKMSAMQIRCKFGQLGPGKGQFNSPHGFCLGIDEDIVVADTNNHRICCFEKTGEFKYQFGIPGRDEGQLWYPRKVAVMRPSGKYVVCDRGNERSRMQIFTAKGVFVRKIAIRYIDIVAGLALTNQGYIVAVDSVSPTVFVISEAGDLIKWFDCSDYMREPSDIAVSGREFFVCDFKGHCVVVFNEEGHFLRRIGCENLTNYPNGIDISDAGDVLIGDSHGNRFHVAVFQRDGSLIGEFECPYVKVSRCCGLKITSEGCITIFMWRFMLNHGRKKIIPGTLLVLWDFPYEMWVI
ncbi:brain tumor protein-like isoform X3 [Ostrea edulis]|uniref:brain tumor protein-like isoform X3 n=1 Tax=Ostrea edulis TaxID=37623 RepID=UPI0024AEB841|nr:brain tumor protein-like isoform X3 [Ostrea edulis]